MSDFEGCVGVSLSLFLKMFETFLIYCGTSSVISALCGPDEMGVVTYILAQTEAQCLDTSQDRPDSIKFLWIFNQDDLP